MDENGRLKLREPRFFFPDPLANPNASAWIKEWISGIGGIGLFPDVRFSRIVALSMLKEAWNEKEFHQENPGASPFDRMQVIGFLQYLTSMTGLFSYEEFLAIKEGEEVPEMISQPVLGFEEVAQIAQARKANGQTIGLFAGAFDPFTANHAVLNNYARSFCDFLITGFDSDELILNRKGKERKALGQTAPRFPISQRRGWASGLPTVDVTVELRPNVIDQEAYIKDYLALGVDVLFVGEPDHPAIPRMQEAMERVGGRVEILKNEWQGIHATQLMEFLKNNPFFNVQLKEP